MSSVLEVPIAFFLEGGYMKWHKVKSRQDMSDLFRIDKVYIIINVLDVKQRLDRG